MSDDIEICHINTNKAECVPRKYNKVIPTPYRFICLWFFFIITLLGGSANCQSFELIVIVPNIDGEFKQPVLFKNSYVQFMSQKK